MLRSKQCKRRIRKKLFLNEFSVYTFELKLDLSANSAEEELVFLDNLIDKLESMELRYMGHFLDVRLRGFIVGKGRYQSPTEAQRQKIIEWCNNHPQIKDQYVGELVDANQI